ncbi:hypothetical protein HanRHA438_Chr14g0678721 [Helianthus annuus]|nr:hypothetical protein HanRHA438_Chr14g0678721 [Helianthus annuus]
MNFWKGIIPVIDIDGLSRVGYFHEVCCCKEKCNQGSSCYQYKEIKNLLNPSLVDPTL